MRIRRLGWAGIELEEDGTHVAIDPIATLGFFEDFWGAEDQRDELVQLDADSLDAVLLTHLHRDHADPEAIAAAVKAGAVVAGPSKPRSTTNNQKFSIIPQEDGLAQQGVERKQLRVGESLQIGPFSAIACDSVDGTGVSQIAWLVKSGDQSVLHCGDTVWHGGFWEIAAEYGSPDVACLPGNGVEVNFPYNQPAVELPVDLTPEQAVDAAYVLGAGRLLPIHFSLTYDHEQIYRPAENIEQRLKSAAEQRGVELIFPPIGEWLEVGVAAAA